MSEVSLLSIEEIIEKINSLNKNSPPRWGEMNSSQMVKHCSKFIDLYLGEISVPFWYKYFGTTIGKLFLRYISKKSPLETPRNIRTDKSLKIIDESLDLDCFKMSSYSNEKLMLYFSRFVFNKHNLFESL